jgi:hypothetical protein
LTKFVAYQDSSKDILLHKALKDIVRSAMNEDCDHRTLRNQLHEVVSRKPKPVLKTIEEQLEIVKGSSEVEIWYDENRMLLRDSVRGSISEIEDQIKVAKLGRYSEDSLEDHQVDLAESFILVSEKIQEAMTFDFEFDMSYLSEVKNALVYIREIGSLKDMAKSLTILEDRLHKIYLTKTYNELKRKG